MTAEPDTRSAQLADASPVVYGYVRTTDHSPSLAAAHEADLVAWCEHDGWQLGAVFRDLGVAPDALIRPGFTAALAALHLPDNGTLLVLDRSHLSTVNTVATRLRSELHRTGATLFIKNEAAPAACRRTAADSADDDRDDSAWAS
ncbi:recombinase family protein [Haloechinothrix salitolerans]|uniref:Recombinase family protein n=1 Tax=Haloechinothrix salitolerans TaxID=926830 RepID=A0ABW2BXT4_9PSEU